MTHPIAPRRSLGAIAILMGGTLLPFLPNFLFGTVPYEDDLANYFGPVMHWVAESLREGRLPLWAPNIYTGFPLFADPEAGTLFPLNWLLVFLDEPFGLLLLLCLTTTLTATCMYAYVRHLGYDCVPSVIAAWVFALGGFATGHRIHISIGNSALTVPLVMLAVDRVLLERGRRQLLWVLVAAMAHALQWLGGHLQPPILTWLLVGAYLIFRLGFDPLRGTPTRTWRQKMFLLAALPASIGVLAFGLVAAQLLPTLELAANSTRVLDADYTFAASYSFPPFNLITFIWPYFFQDQSGARWGLWSNWETAAYAGILPLMLAVVGMAKPLSRKAGESPEGEAAHGLGWGRNRLTVFFALVALVSLWLAMADYAPLSAQRWLSALPIVNALRAPARFVFLCDFALAVLAANGAQGLLSADLRVSAWQARRIPSGAGHVRYVPQYRRTVAAAAIISAALLIAADFVVAGWIGANREATMRWLDEQYSALPNFGLPYPPARLFDFLQWAVWLGNPQCAFGVVWLLLSAGWLALTVMGRLSPRARRASALLIVLVDLSVFAATFWQTAPLQAIIQPDATVQRLRVRGDDARVFSWLQSPTVPDRLLRWDVPDANGYSALELKRHTQLIDALVVNNNRLLDLANVGWIVRPPPLATPAATESTQAEAIDPRAPLVNLAASSPPVQRTFVLSSAARVTHVRIISALEHAPQVRQGETVAWVVLREAQGGDETRLPIRAGVETAEWALDRADVKAIAQHRAAPIAYSFQAHDDFSPSYTRHLYQTDIMIPSHTISAVRLDVIVPTTHWLVYRIALLDEQAQSVAAVERFDCACYEQVDDTSDARIYRNRTALPRAWLVPRARVEANAGKLLERMLQPEFDPLDEVLLEEMPENSARALLTDAPTLPPSGSVELTQLSDEHVHVRVQTHADVFLVMSDTWYVGWRARDNGEPTQIYRADYAYRAVFVRAGQHEIDFVFEPQSVRVGFLISVVSVLCVLALGRWVWHKHSQNELDDEQRLRSV